MDDQSTVLHLENQLCFPLYAASRLTTKLYAPLLQQLDLTYPQYLVMLALWQFGAQPVSAIGERLFLESNTLTPLLKRLEQKGVISRERSSKDERQVVVATTKKGEALKEKAIEIPEAIVSSFDDGSLSVREIIQFQQTLFRVVNALNVNLTTNQD